MQPTVMMPPPWVMNSMPAVQSPPLFARQFGWRPAAQPWIAAPQSRWQQPADSFGQPVADAYPHRPQSRWRPSAGQAAYAAPGQFRPQLYMPNRAPVYRSPDYANRSPMGWRVAHTPYAQQQAGGWSAPPQQDLWRPKVAATAQGWQAAQRFRPASYGRSLATQQPVVARLQDSRSSFTRADLPGWVTTYQESRLGEGCAWCGGS